MLVFITDGRVKVSKINQKAQIGRSIYSATVFYGFSFIRRKRLFVAFVAFDAFVGRDCLFAVYIFSLLTGLLFSIIQDYQVFFLFFYALFHSLLNSTTIRKYYVCQFLKLFFYDRFRAKSELLEMNFLIVVQKLAYLFQCFLRLDSDLNLCKLGLRFQTYENVQDYHLISTILYRMLYFNLFQAIKINLINQNRSILIMELPSVFANNNHMNSEVTLTQLPKMSLNAQVINYIRKKCDLSPQQIERKLTSGESFDIKGEGTEVDTKLIEEVLRQNDFYEKPAQKMMRQQTMRFVKNVIDQWSMQIAKNQMRISQDQIHNYTARLLPFGSYVLDLKSNSSDIDLICVCPNFINRDTHFFVNLVQRIQSDPEVKNLSKVINAKVPIITFQYKETDIDISFCQLNHEIIPREIQKIITKDLVNSITDERSKTSILGRVNNLTILQSTQKQVENFKQTLRFIKVWAKSRGISSNGMGYLGGISWAILVAKICQIFQNHKPSRLISQFFTLFSIWSWKSTPVYITKQPGEQKFDKYLMCIVTPGSAYNSTQRVNQITYKVLYSELRRANEMMSLKKPLSQVCKKSDFINDFPLFIQIDICGRNQTKQQQKDYKDFKGNVQSKVLKLISNIIRFHKKLIQEDILRVVPNPHLFKKTDPTYQFCNSIFFGIDVKPKDTKIDLGRAVVQWCYSISSVRGDKKDSLNIRIFQGKKEDFGDVQFMEAKKKKQEKQDPRLALRAKKGV